MSQPLPHDVEKCLNNLQSKLAYERRLAAEELGNLQIRDERINNALQASVEGDSNSVVRGAASQALYKLGYAQPETVSLDLSSQGVESKQTELRQAAIWYRWLWLSPLITIPTLIVIGYILESYFYDLICPGGWRDCDYMTVTRLAVSIGILVSALWHLVLLIPSLNQKSEFVRWHGRQALLLAGLRTIIPLMFVLIFGEMGVMISILFLIVIWLGGTLWGQGQAKRGDCSLMRWFGRQEALPGPEPKQKPKQAKELDADTLVKIIRYSDNLKNRQLALTELQKRELAEEL